VGSSVHLVAALAGWFVAVLRRVPFVFEVRDLWPQALVDMGALRPTGMVTRLLRGLEKFLYRRARMVISVPPGGVDYIAGLGIPREKVVHIPNGVARREAAAGPAELVSRIRDLRAQGCVVAGYTGWHGLANRVDVLVEAARLLRDRGRDDIRMVLVGDGPEKAACERLAARYGLPNVLFVPPVPRTEVAGLLESVDITLFALRDTAVFRYGLSCNKLFDYLASGRPMVFAADEERNPVRGAEAGICVPAESPEAVAGALEKLADLGPEGRREMGERGRHYVATHHDMGVLAERFLHAVEPPARAAR
jgi:glycosyltransferase involved in cell wall biosynthesis